MKYVPIIKSKRGEMNALKETYDDVLGYICPFIELIPEFISTRIESGVYSDLKNIWRGEELMIDASSYLGEDANSILVKIYEDMDDDLKIIPSVRLDDKEGIVNAAQRIANKAGRGTCLRLSIGELGDPSVVQNFIHAHGLDTFSLDLLVDFGMVSSEEDYLNSTMLINGILGIEDCRRLVIAGGCAPENLIDFSPDEDNFIDRNEWVFWNKHKGKIAKISVFADFTTQHPYILPPTNFPGSKSICYTIADKIVVFRGRRSDPSEAYVDHATVLCDYTDFFCGEDYSYGDKFIKQKRDEQASGNLRSTGNAESWVKVKVNHHIAHVIKNDLRAVAL